MRRWSANRAISSLLRGCYSLIFRMFFLFLCIFSSCSNDNSDISVFSLEIDTIVKSGLSWESQKQFLINSLNSRSPDVFGLQEISEARRLSLLLDLRPYANVTQENSMVDIFKDKTPIFYLRNKFELIAKSSFLVSQISDSNFVDKYYGITSWVKLKELKSGYIFYVFNTKMDSVIRNQNHALPNFLLRKIKLIAGQAPVILMGNFKFSSINSISSSLINNDTSCMLFSACKVVSPIYQTQKAKSTSVSHIEKDEYIFVNSYFNVNKFIDINEGTLSPVIAYLDFNYTSSIKKD